MSEKIYAWLLRLFPSRFRQAYGDDALQLFRDRWRDERGFLPRLRLWFDLLADLIIAVPQQYSRIPCSIEQQFDGVPSFQFLQGEVPRLSALLLGGLLSLVPATAAISATRLDHYRLLDGHVAFAAWAQQRTAIPAAPAAVKIDAAERHRIIESAVAEIKQSYVDSEVGAKIAEAILTHEKSGDYESITDAASFADAVTKQMRDVSHNTDLLLAYSPNTIPQRPPAAPSAESAARYRELLKQQNCTFEKVEILPHNIGYLKLNSFPDLSICEPTATSAMTKLNNADAIIFDLRDNRGGYPATVAFLAAYLFDHPEYWFNPREETTVRSWTRSPVPGNKLADKPAYILTSHRTFSGAEHFSYDLKMLKRATLVGETTGGGAHAGVFHRIDEHFFIAIPEVKAINPYAQNDWEGVGVEPDVKVNPADALDTARKLAEGKLHGR